MVHLLNVIEIQNVGDRAALDLDPYQLAWLLRLWQLVSQNFQTVYDYGRFEKETCALDKDDMLDCAFQRLNLRLTSVAIFMGRLVTTLRVNEMLEVISEYERTAGGLSRVPMKARASFPVRTGDDTF